MAYLSCHGRHVPHIADDGPAGHYSKQVAHHVVFTTVPKCITKLRIILWKKEKKMHPSYELSGGFSYPSQCFWGGRPTSTIYITPRKREASLPDRNDPNSKPVQQPPLTTGPEHCNPEGDLQDSEMSVSPLIWKVGENYNSICFAYHLVLRHWPGTWSPST